MNTAGLARREPDALSVISDPTTWPVLLAGPMVRRVDHQSVAVFVATRGPANLELRIYDGVATAANRPTIGVGTASTVALGQRLHVAVVQATGLNLSPGVLYGYDVAVDETNDSSTSFQTLADLGLLLGAVPLGYIHNELPGFVLPTARDNLRILYTSCRKPHGEGADMLPFFDDLIEADRLNPLDRPQQLFMTGDQIYADDVAPGLLPALTEAAAALLGWTEQLPNLTGTPTYDPSHEDVLPGWRSNFLRDQKVQGKTSYSANHLLFFGEWCAMYLMTWSTALWMPATGPSLGRYTYELAGDQAFGTVYSPATRRAVLFAESLDRARRALANVATYMIFDDHEVTDDWNLNLAVSEKLRGKEMGRRLTRNALCAYAVFQDWGNQPEDYLAGTNGKAILDALTVASTTAPVPLPAIGATPDILDDVLDIGVQQSSSDEQTQRKLWHYQVVGPGHAAIVLDTRTWRSYPNPAHPPSWAFQPQYLKDAWSTGDVGKQLNAALIDPGALALQLDSIPSLSINEDGDQRQVIIVSAAPVIGQLFTENMQRATVLYELLYGNTASAGEIWENEPWAGNGTALSALLDALAPYSPAVILSGDVHYAFTTIANYDVSNGLPARFVQLTSSPGKNSTLGFNALSVAEPLVEHPSNYGYQLVYPANYFREQTPELIVQSARTVMDMIFSSPYWSSPIQAVQQKLDDYEETLRKLEVEPFTWYKRALHVYTAGPVTVDVFQQMLDSVDLPWINDTRSLFLGNVTDDRPRGERDDHDSVLEAELNTMPTDKRDATLNRNRGSVSINNVAEVTFFEDDDGTEWVCHDVYWRHNNQPMFTVDTKRPILTRHEAPLRQPASLDDMP